jgi:hypothetical protein
MSPQTTDDRNSLESGDAAERIGLYRARAEELRTIAEDLMVEENRRVLLRLAESYERMARGLESAIELATRAVS